MLQTYVTVSFLHAHVTQTLKTKIDFFFFVLCLLIVRHVPTWYKVKENLILVSCQTTERHHVTYVRSATTYVWKLEKWTSLSLNIFTPLKVACLKDEHWNKRFCIVPDSINFFTMCVTLSSPGMYSYIKKCIGDLIWHLF